MAVCFLTPIYTSSEKRPLISDHIKGPLVAAFRSPLMKALDRSVETFGLWIVTSVTFIKSANQSSIKLCLIVHLVAVWTLIYLRILPRHNTYNRYRYEKLTLILEALKVTRQTALASFGSFFYVKKRVQRLQTKKANYLISKRVTKKSYFLIELARSSQMNRGW